MTPVAYREYLLAR